MLQGVFLSKPYLVSSGFALNKKFFLKKTCCDQPNRKVLQVHLITQGCKRKKEEGVTSLHVVSNTVGLGCRPGCRCCCSCTRGKACKPSVKLHLKLSFLSVAADI